jgi:carbonic anhydrase
MTPLRQSLYKFHGERETPEILEKVRHLVLDIPSLFTI